MITDELLTVFPPHAARCTPHVTISIPNGELLAQKTLNARLGIIGGLSILGTTGIVRPISAQAWTDTIDAAIDVAVACGSKTVVLSTGRTSEMAAQQFFSSHLHHITPPPLTGGGQGVGEGGSGSSTSPRDVPPSLTLPCQGGGDVFTSRCVLEREFDHFPEEAFIMMGDHVGYALRTCALKGVKRVILAGQFAKLLKIACGHEQTHVSSSELDLTHLLAWTSETPHTPRLTPHFRDAVTARGVLEASGNDPDLIALVCNRAKEFTERLIPGVEIKVLLAGYHGEMLYFARVNS
jgi:cobalt-precorrin-5B (C1)-methyltransferase